jgi:hypothetical protein
VTFQKSLVIYHDGDFEWPPNDFSIAFSLVEVANNSNLIFDSWRCVP